MGCEYGQVGIGEINPKLIELSWALQPSVVNKRIYLGTTNAHSIDLAQKMPSYDVISPAHCLKVMAK